MKVLRLATVASLCLVTARAIADDKTEWELWLPPKGTPVKAVFVAPRWGDGANMVQIVQKNLGEKLGVATMLTRADALTFKESHFLPSITNTLAAAAVEHHRSELANAPLLLWSHSNSAAYIQRMLKQMPERVIAYCLFKPAFGQNTDLGTGAALEVQDYGRVSPLTDEKNIRPMSQAAKEVLGQSIWDMNDNIKAPGYNQEHERKVMLKNMSDARKQGALVHVTLVRGTHHVIDGQQDLMMAFLEVAMAMRLPRSSTPARGPVKLIGGLEKRGWIQNPESKSIYAYSDYPDKRQREGWWLPTWDYAGMWNAYALNAKGEMVAPKKTTTKQGTLLRPSTRKQ